MSIESSSMLVCSSSLLKNVQLCDYLKKMDIEEQKILQEEDKRIDSEYQVKREECIVRNAL